MLELKCVMMSVEVRLDCSQTGVWSGKKLSAGGITGAAICEKG